MIDVPAQKTIDNFNPLNKDEFLELSSMIVQKLAKFEVCFKCCIYSGKNLLFLLLGDSQLQNKKQTNNCTVVSSFFFFIHPTKKDEKRKEIVVYELHVTTSYFVLPRQSRKG